MNVKNDFKKHIGTGVEVNFPSAGLIFGNGVSGIVKEIIQPNFVVLDYCNPGNKAQRINIDKINTYAFVDKDETKELKDYYIGGKK